MPASPDRPPKSLVHDLGLPGLRAQAEDAPFGDRLRVLDERLRELSDLSAELLESLRNGQPDPVLAERFVAVWREAVRGDAVLELFREVERERQENQTLMDISMKLSSASAIEDVLRTILDLLKQVVAFDAAGIFVYNREMGQIEIDMLSGYEGASRELIHRKFQEAVKAGQGIVGTVIQTGHPIYVPDIREDPRYIAVRETTLSELAVPIVLRDEVVGAFNLESDEVDAFTERDLRSLTTFANHAGVAIERARTDRLRQHSRRIQEEIHLARRIQMSFLPGTLPSFAPYDLAGMNFPSSEVGGDYFDFICITDNDMGVAIGDVTGHGVGAALLMANFRACLRIESRNNFAIRTILGKVNDYLYETNMPDSFVTAVYGVLDRRHNTFSYSNAGHNPPFRMRRDGSVEQLEVGGLILGAFPSVIYKETTISLQPGDLLVFYTDGVTEAHDADGNEFGLERLVDLVREHRDLPAAHMVRRICDTVHDYQSAASTQDDLTLSIIKYVSTIEG
ncbi:MAG TPA: GAF domain-containing SpoIIE family protein phosphatase [bacterium]